MSMTEFRFLVFRTALWFIFIVLALPLNALAEAAPAAEHDRPGLPTLALDALSEDANLATRMLGKGRGGNDERSLSTLMSQGDWQRIGDNPALLEAPREHTTLWLKARLVNRSEAHIERWLELSPWRLNQVESWILDTASLDIKHHFATGLDTPVSEREVESKRALVPVTLAPGESVILVLRIYSDSRPFLEINSWDPVALSVDEVQGEKYYAILLASVLTLFIVLVLQLNRQYALLGVWLVVTFFFEAEKEGYFSQMLFSSLADYSANLRFSTWILTEALFLTASVYLLGLRQHPRWRYLPSSVLVVTALFSVLTFVVDGAVIRNIGSAVDLALSLIWLLMVPAALSIKRKWQYAMLGLLSVWWVTSTFILLGYIGNFYYTASFASSKIIAEFFVILGLVLVFSCQKRAYENELENTLRNWEKEQREDLEYLVQKRTRDLNAALEDARKSNKKKMLFLGKTSHELKSPLTSIMGYSHLVMTEKGRISELGNIIHGSATHMHNLVNRLTDYARGAVASEREKADVYLYSFVHEISHEARILSSRKSNQFELELCHQLPPVVRCDVTSLRQVLINLIDNAAKYTEDGRVTLSVASSATQAGVQYRLEFTLKDTGCGISHDFQERLFNPFEREVVAGEGFGLGLSIVKDLVDHMGGDITYYSDSGVGTEVVVGFPVEAGLEDNVNAESSNSPAYRLPVLDAGGKRAWVVEDALPVLELLESELETLGFIVKCFQRGDEAVQALKDECVMPDLIITDHRLPGASGDDLLKAARAHAAHVPVILLSATWSVVDREGESSPSGYAACLAKPVNLATLRRDIARACNVEVEEPGQEMGPLSSGQATPTVTNESLEQLLSLGAVSDIIEWCDALVRARPDQADFAAEVRRMAEAGDLAAIATRLQ